MRVLLDTNAYSALMADRGCVAGIVRRADAVLLSAIVLGELLFGFQKWLSLQGESGTAR